MKPYLLCPTCGSDDIMKNGTTRRGKQNYKCRDCGRQFVEDPQWKPIDPERKAMVDCLLLEKIPGVADFRYEFFLKGARRAPFKKNSVLVNGGMFLNVKPEVSHSKTSPNSATPKIHTQIHQCQIPLAGIARVMSLSEDWQRYVNRCYAQVRQQLHVQPKAKGHLEVQMDELWSFVDDKGNKQWVWLALDVATREIVGCYIGDRSAEAALGLWQSMPAVYRQCAIVYSDYWQAYAKVLPSNRHRAVGKESGLTSYIERFNNTLRQRVSRLVRKTLSFSKKLENYVGAIWHFIHHYNKLIRSELSGCS